MLLELGVFVIFVVSLVALTANNVILRIKKSKLVGSVIQLELDKVALYDQLSKINANSDASSIEQTEGFLRFVSESRDWAFGYIEDVQKAIKDLQVAIDAKDRPRVRQLEKDLLKFLPSETDLNK